MHLGTACYCDTAQPVLTDTGAHRASLDDWTGEAVSRPPQEQSRLMRGREVIKETQVHSGSEMRCKGRRGLGKGVFPQGREAQRLADTDRGP